MPGNHQDGEWCGVHLGEVTYEVTDRLGTSTTDVPVYGVDRMDGLTPSPKYQAADLVRYKKVSPGMFAYNPMRLNIGSIGYCSSRHKLGVVSPDYVVFACRRDYLEPDYLYWLTKSASWADWVEAAGVGSVRVRIYYRELKRMPVLLPPVAAQRSIVGVLRVLEDKIEQNRRTALALERLARAIFRAWFVDFEPVKAKAAGATSFPSMPQTVFDALPNRFIDSEIGPVPEGWELKPIGDVVSVKGGGTPSTKSPEYWEGGTYCWVTPKDMSRLSHPVLLDTERRITDAGINGISSGLLPHGTVLLSSRAPVGYLAIAGVPTAINQGFIAMVCDGPLPPTYVLQWAYASMGAIHGRASGTTFPEISKKNFRPLPVIVPIPEVVAAFRGLADPLFDLLTATVKEDYSLVAIRDYLLPRLLNGSVRVEPVNG